MADKGILKYVIWELDASLNIAPDILVLQLMAAAHMLASLHYTPGHTSALGSLVLFIRTLR